MAGIQDEFFTGGLKSASFKDAKVGYSITGTICEEPTSRQATKPNGEPKFWDDGEPVKQLIIPVQTDLRDDADDDGRRGFYADKGSKLLRAVVDAVRAAGQRELKVGATLTVQYDGDGEQKNKAFNAPKLYSATYEAPANGALSAVAGPEPVAEAPAAAPAQPSADELRAKLAALEAQKAAEAAAVAAPAEPAAPAGLSDEEVAKLKALGIL